MKNKKDKPSKITRILKKLSKMSAQEAESTIQSLAQDVIDHSKEKRQYLRIRNVCGLLGVLLPWIALFSAGIVDERPSEQWWWSISATYYQTPALVGILTPCALVLMLYIGYDKPDNIITSLSGIFGMGIVLFPCSVSWIPDGTEVGFFQLPIQDSNTIHCICAALFFLLLAINSITQFTNTDRNKKMTPRKEIRNKIYRVCGWSMIVVMGIFGILCITDAPGWTTMIIEIILLHLFGLTWLVKGEAFPFLNDQ